MPDQTLLMALDEIRRRTLQVLDGVDDEQARWAPAGLQNSILWHAGHCYILLEWMTSQALGRQAQIPEGWFEMFSWASRPAEVPAEKWPPLDEVVTELRVQHGRMHKLLEKTSDELLDSPAGDGSDRTAHYRIFHALHDEACHSGEIWLLRKMLRARTTT